MHSFTRSTVVVGTLLIVVALILLNTGRAIAFDGERQGFVMGFGAGVSSARWEGNAQLYYLGDDYDERNAGTAVQITFGWGFDYHNVLAYEVSANIAESDTLDDETLGGALSGVFWYHYFGDEGGAWFTTIGIGRYVFSTDDFGSARGNGVLLGGGYEFAPHWQVRLAVVLAESEEAAYRRVADLEHRDFMLTISCFAY